MEIKPEEKKELKLEVKGYGCYDDCHVYFAHETSIWECGWHDTAETTTFF
ncbi:hypothetical protein [Paenibacillus alvei]|uniref:Uncharacterized protein n=1 Tax=Paenibacillus alvei TaxID=44250 RepID=A0AAP7A5M9_PAEAL|nr:hypothetical protein [Paenibacillus alvei]NOJ73112.1 hypothetical protein [Paenibacillus alvei]